MPDVPGDAGFNGLLKPHSGCSPCAGGNAIIYLWRSIQGTEVQHSERFATDNAWRCRLAQRPCAATTVCQKNIWSDIVKRASIKAIELLHFDSALRSVLRGLEYLLTDAGDRGGNAALCGGAGGT